MKFNELEIDPLLKKGIEALGYETMTPIQAQSIQPILDGRDLLGLAKTGSGKTSACAIPVLQRIDHSLDELQVLILVPTRELAFQYCEEIDRLSKFLKTKVSLLYGGVPMGEQRLELETAQLAVATPGRFIDHIYSSNVSMRHIKCFVLDEADEMLNMGFMEDVDFILSCIGHEHQKLLFSATMPSEINKLAQNTLKDPVQIKLIVEEKIPDTIEHYFIQTPSRNRIECIQKYLSQEIIEQAIIFCNSRINCEKLYEILSKRLRSIEMIHGGLPQQRRTSIFERFKKKRVKFMIATDVAGRGLDFSHVTHVINYDFPMDLESFTHRTGRTGRMGKKGKSLTFAVKSKEHILKQITEKIGINPIWMDRYLELHSSAQQSSQNRFNRRAKNSSQNSNVGDSHPKERVVKQSRPDKKTRANNKKNQKVDRHNENNMPPNKRVQPARTFIASESLPKKPPKETLVETIKQKARKIWEKLF